MFSFGRRWIAFKGTVKHRSRQIFGPCRTNRAECSVAVLRQLVVAPLSASSQSARKEVVLQADGGWQTLVDTQSGCQAVASARFGTKLGIGIRLRDCTLKQTWQHRADRGCSTSRSPAVAQSKPKSNSVESTPTGPQMSARDFSRSCATILRNAVRHPSQSNSFSQRGAQKLESLSRDLALIESKDDRRLASAAPSCWQGRAPAL